MDPIDDSKKVLILAHIRRLADGSSILPLATKEAREGFFILILSVPAIGGLNFNTYLIHKSSAL